MISECCYQVDVFWRSSSCSFHRVMRGSFDECLDYAISSYMSSDAHWSIVLGEVVDANIFFPLRLVARSAYVPFIS